jgi:tripartite-type tricarboxylate transporter receptor subunit TctC
MAARRVYKSLAAFMQNSYTRREEWRRDMIVACTPGYLRGLAWTLVAGVLFANAQAATADDFYKNKQIKLIVGADAGGSYDIPARLVAQFLGQHIPGDPQIVVQDMQGAGSINATNYVYSVAPQDGTVLLAPLQTLVYNQLFRDKSVRFDAGQMHWIGNPTASVNVIVTLDNSSVKTFQDALQKPVVIGITSAASSGGMEIALANNVLGAKFRPVTGYRGGNAIDIALERGEVLGRAGQSWDGWKQTRPAWVKDKKLNVLVQIGQERAKDLPDVPLLTDVADNEQKRQILALYSNGVALGRPLAVAPGVPADRVATLRAAFRATMNDPKFIETAAKAGIVLHPIYGEQLQSIVTEMLAAPRDIVDQLDKARTLTAPASRK